MFVRKPDPRLWRYRERRGLRQPGAEPARPRYRGGLRAAPLGKRQATGLPTSRRRRGLTAEARPRFSPGQMPPCGVPTLPVEDWGWTTAKYGASIHSIVATTKGGDPMSNARVSLRVVMSVEHRQVEA